MCSALTKNFQQSTTDFSFFMSDFFVTMIYWASTEVLLNLVASLDSAMPYLEFEPIIVF